MTDETTETYHKRSGVINKGHDYEHLHVARIVLQLVKDKNVKNFQISSNDDSAGSFDDIVVKIEQECGVESFAIQLKHVGREALSIDALKNQRGGFSISKYFTSYQEKHSPGQKYILLTNLPFTYENNMQFKLDGEDFHVKVEKHNPSSVFKLSEKTDYCYKFHIIGEPLSSKNTRTVQNYQEFLDSFFIYPDQDSVETLKKKTSGKFREMFLSSDIEFDQYLKTIVAWNMQKATVTKLNKKWMQRMIAIHLLSSRMKSLCVAPVTEKMKTLREAILAFNISFFEKSAYDKVKELWGDAINEFDDLNETNRLKSQYQLSSTYIDNIHNMDPKMFSELLWLKGISPLIVVGDPTVYKVIELCPEEKFIVFDRQTGADFSGFHNLSDLKRIPNYYEKIVNTFTCSLQEKEEMVLNDIIKENNDFLITFKADDLLEMLDGPCNIGGKKEVLPEPYIERYLSLNIIDLKYLKQISEDTLIILHCENDSTRNDIKNKLSHHNFIDLDKYLNEEVENVPAVYDVKSHLEKSNIGSTIFLSTREANIQEFQDICTRKEKIKACHQFKHRRDGNLELIRSEGNVGDLEKYILSEKSSVEEKILWQSQSKNYVNVIISDPGMGKTELMKSFKNNSSSKMWTVIIYPKDVHSFITNTESLGGDHQVEEFKNFLFREKYGTLDNRDLELLKLLDHQNDVIYVWDALDEISREHLETVTDIILHLSKEGRFQWITSRRHLQSFLEAKFNILSMDINQFNETEQVFYVKKRLENFSSQEKIERVVEIMKSTFVLVEHKDILGIPLQIFMITELFRQGVDKYLDMLNNMFTLTDLYHYFIEEKFNVYYKEKAHLDLQNFHVKCIVEDSKQKTLKLYEKLALLALFPPEILKRLNIHSDKVLESVRANDISVGLITDLTNKIPRFLHSSFAEYFAAGYFSKKSELRDILKEIIFDPKYCNVRFFFDLLLAKDSPPHIAVLYKDFDVLKKCVGEIQTFKDAGGRSALHLACSWGQRYPRLSVTKVNKTYVIDDLYVAALAADAKEYLEMLEYLFERCEISESDNLFNMTTLTYAQRSDCLAAELNIIQKQNTKLSQNDTINVLYYSARFGYDHVIDLSAGKKVPFIKTKKCDKTLLHISVLHKNYVMKLLQHDNYRKKINVKDSMGNTPLHETSYSNCHETASILVQNGAKINEKNNNGLTSVFIASGFGHDQTVESLIVWGADLNLADNNGFTPLYVAAQKKHEKIVKFLVEKGAKINRPESDGFTPLHIACYDGNERTVKVLISSGARIDRANNEGFTPLHLAAQEGHVSIVEQLVDRDAKLDIANKDGFTPLHISCQNGHEEVSELLVRSGAKINLTTKDGATPLYIACQRGHEDIASFLASSAARVNIADAYGFTPLHVASQEGFENVVRLLVASGSRVNRANNEGFTPLHIACQNGHRTIAEFLIASGALVNRGDTKHFRPLHIACQNGHDEIVQLLISSKVEIDLVDNDGFAALHVACDNGYEHIAKILVRAGANINLPNNGGFTPLYLACQNGHEKTAIFLIESNADIDLPNKYGFTPLHIACEYVHEKIVELLVNSGAKINSCNSDGHTPFYIASRKGNSKIASLLFSKGGRINSAF